MASELPPFEWAEPADLTQAVALAAAGWVPVAGGVDLVRAMRRTGQAPARLLSVDRIAGLDAFHGHPRYGLRIGARIRAGRLLPDIWTGKRFAAVHESVEQFDAPHVANMGTVVGNLCAARADYDLPVSLMAMKGEVSIAGPSGTRQVPLTQFYRAPGETVLTPGEIVTEVFCPGPGTDGGSAFKKLDLIRRRAGDPGRLSAAATVIYGTERERIVEATLVLGGVAMPRRFAAAEAMLVGELPAPDLFTAAAEAALAGLPLSGVIRAQARALLRDALMQANARAQARHDHFDDAAEIAQEAL